MSQYERPNIAAMQGYASGEQPQDGRSIKLNTNENPYPPSPKVAQALADFATEQLRIYPQPDARALRQAVANHHGLAIENVVITHAGDEALRLAVTTFVAPEGVVASTEPTYSLYPVLTQIQGAQMVTQALEADWSLPADFAASMNQADAQLTCVVNPHAPSGHFTSIDALRAVAEELTGVLLVDEAYVDFVDEQGPQDATELVRDLDNVLILRTFSKGYSLAGLRLGYLLGISQVIGLASIEDQAYAQQTWRTVRGDRELLAAELRQLGFTVADSQTNFLLAQVPEGANAEALYQGLKTKGILVRYFATPRLKDSLRITVGTGEQNQRLVGLLTELLAG